MGLGSAFMTKKRRYPKRWWILALLNVLVIEYPASVCINADADGRLTATLTLAGILFVLAIVNLCTIVGVLVE
jgi:hypothetical protein